MLNSYHQHTYLKDNSSVNDLDHTWFRILLLEDNVSDAYRITEMLEEAREDKWVITHAKRLKVALNNLNNSHFDIVLSDLSLPDSQGLDTINSLHSVAKNTPLIVLTGLDDKEIALQALARGAQDYLVKDQITPEVLVRTIRYARERGQILKQLQESERRFRGIFDQAFQLMALLTPQGNFLEINQTILEFGGVKAEYFVGLPIWEAPIWNGDDEVKEWLKNAIIDAKKGKLIRHEIQVKGASNVPIWIDFSIKPVKDEIGNVTLLIAEGRDISDRKQAEAQLKDSLQEKEWLLKEIHHRVKNNLNIVSSLLKLQSQYIEDDWALALFRESQNRIKAMGLIHEKLYQSLDLRRIAANDYIAKLAITLLDSYNVSSHRIQLKLDLAEIWFDPDTAIPCGLIINELVTNSLKYAFPQAKAGEIYIKLSDDSKLLNLIVSDNGIGLPPNFNIEEVESLGLQLVYNLTEQLDGNLEILGNKGTAFKISFSKPELKKE